jgi:branched-chain amino acid transport system permease protein
MVMYAPGGFASLILMNLRVAAFGKLGRIWTSYLALGGAALAALVGAAAMIEMLYHRQLNEALGPELRFMGATLDSAGVDAWFGAGWLMLVGIGLFEVARRHYARQWGEIQEDIEKEIKRRESL